MAEDQALSVESGRARPGLAGRITAALLALALLAAWLLGACVPPVAPQGTAPARQDTSLKIALLPVMDVLPFHVAQQNGYFEAEGITVEGVPVKSAQERDALVQAGQVDGELTDLLSPVLFNRERPTLKVVYTARRAFPDSPMFRILGAPGSGLRRPADLKGIAIGISQNTVIEYLTERLLQAEGLSRDDYAITEVSAIPVRFELLMKGELQAATLPDPLASGALAGGATLIIDDSSYPRYAQSVLVFTVRALQEKPATVRKFLQAWERAANEINAHPEAYRDLLIKVGRVPEAIQGTFKVPPFPVGSITTEAEMQDVVAWSLDRGLIERELPYEQLVDPSFLP